MKKILLTLIFLLPLLLFGCSNNQDEILNLQMENSELASQVLSIENNNSKLSNQVQSIEKELALVKEKNLELIQEAEAKAKAEADPYSKGKELHNLGNYDEALKWFRLGADQGDADAQTLLGIMYSGQCWYGIAKNGPVVPICASYSDRVTGNRSVALKWFRLAVDQGNASAQYHLGKMYQGGNGVIFNGLEAMKWFRLAADQGYVLAQNELASMYQLGLIQYGVVKSEKSDSEAFKWYKLAAAKGHAPSQFSLGGMYFNGRGVTQNYSEAMRFFKLAADQGHVTALYDLGRIYEEGYGGVTQSDREAIKYYKLAADQGHIGAQNNLERMKNK